MSPMGSIAAFFRNYVAFRGRASRSEFWWAALFVGLVLTNFHLVDKGLGTKALYPLACLAFLLPGLALQVRRLHDLGRTGWWVLVQAVLPAGIFAMGLFMVVVGLAPRGSDTSAGDSLVNACFGVAALGALADVVLLVWFCMRGTPGPNRHGPDPLADARP